MLTRRGVGLLGAAGALWLVARSFGVPEAQMAAVAGLVLIAFAVAFTAVTSTRLRLDRVVSPSTLWFDAPGSVVLTVTNAGRMPTAAIELLDAVPAGLADRPRARLEPIRPGGRVTVRYGLRGAQRGRFRIGPATVRLRDPFGLAVRTRTLEGTTEITVYPPVWRLPAGLPLGGASSSGGGGPTRLVPSGEDLADVREYVRGDDLRTVHWPSTAHRGKIMVRQAESSLSPRAVVLLDVRASRHTGNGPTASIEMAVAAAASAGYHLAARGRSVVLLDRPFTRPVPPMPWERWLQTLAATDTEDVDLPGLLHQIAQGSAGDGTIVAIVTTPDAAELRRLVRAGRGFSTRLAVVLDTASHRERPSAVPVSGDALAAAGSLRAAGWRATVVKRGDRLDERWRELLSRPRATASAR